MAKKIIESKEKKTKEKSPEGGESQSGEQPYAAVSDILKFAEDKSKGVIHRELSLAYQGIIKALKDVDSWAKNIAEVELSIENSKKPKK